MKAEIGVIQSPAKEHSKPPKLDKARMDPPLQPSEREFGPANFNFRPQEL